MDEMREIITLEEANRLFLIAAIALPALGLVIGAFWGFRIRRVVPGALSGLAVGLIGPVNLLLWNVYNLITNRLGLDTVKNLLVNLGLFLLLGVITGVILGRWSNRRRADPPSALPDANAIGPDS